MFLTLAPMFASPLSGLGLLDLMGSASTCNWGEAEYLRFFDVEVDAIVKGYRAQKG